MWKYFEMATNYPSTNLSSGQPQILKHGNGQMHAIIQYFLKWAFVYVKSSSYQLTKKKVNKNVAINLQTTKECKMSDVEKFPKNTYACKDVHVLYFI